MYGKTLLLSLLMLFVFTGCRQQPTVFKDISGQYRPPQSEQVAEKAQPLPEPIETVIQADNAYDAFILTNRLPSKPKDDEPPEAYSQRLKSALAANTDLKFINSEVQPFSFGSLELKGLKIFLNTPYSNQLSDDEVTYGGIGHCFSCHAPPNFSSNRVPGSLRRSDVKQLRDRFDTYRIKAIESRSSGHDSIVSRMALSDNDYVALSAFLRALTGS